MSDIIGREIYGRQGYVSQEMSDIIGREMYGR